MKTVANLALVASLTVLTAGCMSSSNTATSAQAAAGGQAASTTGGFVSPGTVFTCTGGQLNVIGDGGSVTLVSDTVRIPVQGGPLVYRAGVNLVVFDNATYQRFRVLNGATLVNTCTR